MQSGSKRDILGVKDHDIEDLGSNRNSHRVQHFTAENLKSPFIALSRTVIRVEEFTCRCPVTNQPDYAKIEIIYEGDTFIETKSLKLYLEKYRDVGIFHEVLSRQIAVDLLEMLPLIPAIEVIVRFNVRGGSAVENRSSVSRMVFLPCGQEAPSDPK